MTEYLVLYLSGARLVDKYNRANNRARRRFGCLALPFVYDSLSPDQSTSYSFSAEKVAKELSSEEKDRKYL